MDACRHPVFLRHLCAGTDQTPGAILFSCGISVQAQTKRPDDFRAKYQLKEVVVMSRHNIRSPLTSGGAAHTRVTPHQWFAWTSPSSQLSLRGGVLETEMGQFFRKWLVGEGLLPDNYRPEGCPITTVLRAVRCCFMPIPVSVPSPQRSISLPVFCPLPMWRSSINISKIRWILCSRRSLRR